MCLYAQHEPGLCVRYPVLNPFNYYNRIYFCQVPNLVRTVSSTATALAHGINYRYHIQTDYYIYCPIIIYLL